MNQIEVENLTKQSWSKSEFEEYRKYIESIKGDELNCKWEQRIVNTKLPCCAQSCTKARSIASAIFKGNYIEFLQNIFFENHIDTLVYAYILNRIKDFNVFEKYLLSFAKKVDNWASCDALKHKNKDKSKLLNLCNKLKTSKYVFARRIAVNIMFDLLTEQFLPKIFNLLNFLKDEQEYYVNMSGAWLLCECFVKYRDKTLEYFKNNTTNNFIINKAISKCRDSFRVSNLDKEFLKSLKRN